MKILNFFNGLILLSALFFSTNRGLASELQKKQTETKTSAEKRNSNNSETNLTSDTNLSSGTQSEDEINPKSNTKNQPNLPALQPTETQNETSKQKRDKLSYFGLLNYSPFDVIIPSKIGATFSWQQDGDNTWELEYLRGKVAAPFIIQDLGAITDQRISLMKRSFAGRNSLNFSYGLTYFDFNIHLGDALLNGLTGGQYPSIDVVRLQSVGFNLGVGNRWTFDRNITFGVDWISWSQPIYVMNEDSAFLDYSTNPDDRDDVETAIDIASYFPRLAFLKLQLGVGF